MGYNDGMGKQMNMEQVFWSHVAKSDDCWAWTASLNRKGYGQFEFSVPSRRTIRAHRASWTIHFGEVPPGMWVLHKCDNPACVRPDHLFLGTNVDNVRDKINKGRQVKGIGHYCARFTEDQVRSIREEHIRGLSPGKMRVGSMRYLAKKYGVGFSAIQSIINRRTWKHLH